MQKTQRKQRRPGRQGNKPGWQDRIVNERVERLVSMAGENAKSDPERARTYSAMASRLCTRYRVRMPSDTKAKFCRKCFTPMVPGHNCTIRISPARRAVIITCKKCGKIKREILPKKKV